MSPSTQPATVPDRSPPTLGVRCAVGVAVVLGWLLQDLAVVAVAGRPQDTLLLGWHSLLALGLGALLGALTGLPRFVPGALLVTTVWSLLPKLLSSRFSHVGAWRPRVLLLVLVVIAVSLWIGRYRIGRVRLAFLLGILAAALVAWLRDTPRAPHGVLTACAALALPLGFLGTFLRPLVEVLLFAAATFMVAREIPAALRTERPDVRKASVPGPREAPNLVLIVLDTVRADRLGCYGYTRPTTPLLDRWVADHFTLYSNARATSSWTLPSHGSLFTGLQPAEHGATHSGLHAHPIRSDVPTLAEHLYATGYRTGGVFANNVYLRPRFELDRGFEHFDDRKASMFGNYLPLAQLLGASLRTGRMGYRDGEVITRLGLEWIDSLLVPVEILDEEEEEVIDVIYVHENPFFLALNYMEVHGPNMPPPPFDEAFGPERPLDPIRPGPEFQSLNYDRELLHLDSVLHDLLQGLVERELFHDTAIIITSDHGEALGDHGFYMHGWTLYDELVRVPLLVKPAGEREVARVDDNINSAGTFLLALEQVGLPSAAPPQAEDPPTSEWYVIPEGIGEAFKAEHPDRDLTADLLAWVDGRRKWIVSSKGLVETYDLEADPRELEPLPVSEAEREAALERARSWWDAHDVVAPPPASATALELERLRHMGYIGDDEGSE